jgi:short chain dehydrogenase
MRPAGNIAIITGAASGMGVATARMFAREGAKVVIADVMEHAGGQVADAIGADAHFVKLVVTNEEYWGSVCLRPGYCFPMEPKACKLEGSMSGSSTEMRVFALSGRLITSVP